MRDKTVFQRVRPRLCDPETGESLKFDGSCFRSESGTFPVIRDVPRFVADDDYAASFSFQWLDCGSAPLEFYHGGGSSEDRFARKTGLSPDDLRGRLVLDAGVGAGQYADVASRWGADVVGVDLSYGVEAASCNFSDRNNVWILQADITALPFCPVTFDAILALDVLHHTPDPRGHFLKLVPLLKPGGILAISVHPDEPPHRARQRWGFFIRRLPLATFHEWCRWSVVHVQARSAHPVIGYLRKAFPISAAGLGPEHDIRETFGYYTPRYQSLHSPKEVRLWFQDAGLEDIREPNAWGTCVRGRAKSQAPNPES